MNNNRGFTFVELTAVIVLLALISVLAFSAITKMVNSKRDNISEAMSTIIYNASNLYMSYNPNYYVKVDGNRYCIKLRDLVDLDLLEEPIIDPITNKNINLDSFINIDVNVDEFVYSINNSCKEKR